MLKTAVKNLYELLVIIKPNINDDDLDKSITQIESSIKNYGGSIVKTDEPLRKRVAQKIKGFKEGYYVSILFNSPTEAPNLLKRSLSISDDVMRHVIVKRENKR
jgi:small subunit ribosomal protein S6